MHLKDLVSEPYLQYILGGGMGVFVLSTGFLWFQLTDLQDTHQELQHTLEIATGTADIAAASSSRALTDRDTHIAQLSGTLENTEEELEDTEDDLKDTKKDLRKEEKRNDEFQDQIDTIAGTVGDLDKLSKTDEELLQKYSKVYFLNEHYIPESTKEIKDKWKYSENKPNELHSKVMPFFEDMLKDAQDDDIDLWVVSAYRSFSTQAQLKSTYTVLYGSGANTFSADQGFSEHQLGTTVDFTTSGRGGALDGFQNTKAYDWLLDNAHKYGFTLSYPQNNAFYVFEPWHWRFVGTELAKDLDRKNDSFYDLDQRDIDQYLLNIFD